MSTAINVRSPFIVTIDEVGQTNSKIELRFKRLSDVAFPSDPDYTLSKNIPASNLTETNYNIAPFCREYISHLSPRLSWTNYGVSATFEDTVETEYVQVLIYTYSNGVLLDANIQYTCFDGFGYYADGTNPSYMTDTDRDGGVVMMDEGTYYYHLACTNPTSAPLTNTDLHPQYITVMPGEDWDVEYVNLVTMSGGVAIDLASVENTPIDVTSVYLNNFDKGYRVQFKNKLGSAVWTGYFRPLTESKYDVIPVDFINKYGAWQRTFMFKASNDYLEVQTTDYNLFQSDLTDYDIKEGQIRTFNVNGKESIKCNTGWVGQDYNDNTLKHLMLSERILVGNKPARMKTKSVELQKHLNNKTINYSIEFDYSFETINSIV